MVAFLRLLASLISFLSKSFKLGTGVAWSGEVAMILDPNILGKLIPKGAKVVFVAGTNGKTTTAKMIEHLTKERFSVVLNDTGANIENGLVGSILTKHPGNLYIFEIDEFFLPKILASLTPDIIVLLNLFRDQLDRFGEVDTIAKKWQLSFKSLKNTELIVNADDPQLAHLSQNLKNVTYFGLNNRKKYLKKQEHAVDSVFCPDCGSKLVFQGVYLSHLGDYKCPKCGFTHPKIASAEIKISQEGLYMEYNALAATLVASKLGVSKETLENFQPAFGRQEILTVSGRRVKILLSKNPAGFNASLRTYLDSQDKGLLLLALNDNVPDGTDVSWIWDVDFENLRQEVLVTGSRELDLALRLKYAQVPFKIVNLKTAVTKTPKDQTLWILPTYTAMLEIRKTLTGKKIL